MKVNEKVVLVNRNDERVGTKEKLKAHQNGASLHRAFSIFIFNSEGKLLLQKRAKSKYHSGGLWSNSCCSHPRPNESLEEATKRKLKEEMGFTCDLKEIFNFIYKEKVGELTEWEFDHVFVGVCDPDPNPNPKEVSEWKWVSLEELKRDLEKNPDLYTPWFKIIMNEYYSQFKEWFNRLSF